ncbi:holotricin-3-like isoform X3 [Drosophila albomicans]|uniref:Holotricin-3-like isoform X1 n=1 Tax=Drosophila albomicans TaxID=7291 RepID=A0A6P8WP61_DROAB|nr:holotricin-3-like isoform X1 [Drosophila albomicans]XP_051861653.1 holotricin-3-like isoform X2 [Drosophila albomicans]XP_051861654.1 holotricin-3-like isoform X3 [Drosophila albomicans]
MKLFIQMALCLISLAVPSMAAPWYGKGKGHGHGGHGGHGGGGHGGGGHEGGKGGGFGGITLQGPDIVFQFDPLDEVYANDPIDMYYI